jgi:hypothetical protein
MAKPPRSGGSEADVLDVPKQENKIDTGFGEGIAITKAFQDKKYMAYRRLFRSLT